MKIRKYVLNCFLLLIPVFLWNIILVGYLPKAYSPDFFEKDLPNWISYGEIILRIMVFAFPTIMVFSLKTRLQRIGLITYLIGLIIYFSSWTIQIISPESNWSQSLVGFVAPAFTTLFFFVGIGIIGNKVFFKFPYLSHIYFGVVLLFVAFHTAHAYIAFQNLHY